MLRLAFLYLSFFLACQAFGQQEENKLYFSEALLLHLPKYEKNSQKAYRFREFETGQRLFDSLVTHCLTGSYMDDFSFKKLNGKETAISSFKKPIYLMTRSSWITTTKGEIPALNRLAKQYRDQIDFIVLFWDDQKTAQAAARSYNDHIRIVYVDELSNKKPYVISQLKHSLGLPTTFLLDSNKKILDIKRVVAHPPGKSFEDSFNMNINSIREGIANHLLSDSTENSQDEPLVLN